MGEIALQVTKNKFLKKGRVQQKESGRGTVFPWGKKKEWVNPKEVEKWGEVNSNKRVAGNNVRSRRN